MTPELVQSAMFRGLLFGCFRRMVWSSIEFILRHLVRSVFSKGYCLTMWSDGWRWRIGKSWYGFFAKSLHPLGPFFMSNCHSSLVIFHMHRSVEDSLNMDGWAFYCILQSFLNMLLQGISQPEVINVWLVRRLIWRSLHLGEWPRLSLVGLL